MNRMMPQPVATRSPGFTLVEVTLSLGIAAFALVMLLGLYPLGLRESALGIFETRASHLAHAAFAELQSGTFEEAICFGQKLNLARLDTNTPLSVGAAFSAEGTLQLLPLGSPGVAFGVDFSFRQVTDGDGVLLGNVVTLAITPLRMPHQPPLQFQTLITAP